MNIATLLDATAAKARSYTSRGLPIPATLAAAMSDLEAAARDLAAHRAAHPLAYATLWAPECRTCPHPDPTAKAPPRGRRGAPMAPTEGGLHVCPTCGAREHRTSQIAIVRALLSGEDEEAFALGGNRSGKTEAGAQLAVAFALGRDHPDVQAWAKLNGLDIRRIPRKPTLVWAVSQTFGMSIHVQRAKLDLYLPSGTKRRAWEMQNEAVADLPGGGRILCKAAAQSGAEGKARNPFEGASIGFAWVDEEIPTPTGYQSIMARTTDQDGLVLNTMTPLSGWTPFLESRLAHINKGTPKPPRLRVDFLHAIDNPHVSAEVVEGKWAGQPEAIRRARLRGEIVALEGAVHPDFAQGVHIIPAFRPPDDWPRVGGIDFGTRAPFVHLWLAHDEANDVLHVIREHYRANATLRDHAQEIWAVEGCPDCQPADFGSDEWNRWLVKSQHGNGCATCQGTGLTVDAPTRRYADPEGKGERNTLNADFAISTAPAVKDRPATFESLFDRLAVDPQTGLAGLVVHDSCPQTIREFQRLVWAQGRKEARMETRGDDHAHDVVRYVAHKIRRRAGHLGDPT